MWTKQFWLAATDRATRTFAQALIGFVGVAVVIEDVNWIQAVSGSAIAALISILTSLTSQAAPIASRDKPS